METDFHSDCLHIKLTGSQLKDSTFKKHVIYQISGEDSKGNFQVHRRYKEFLCLHDLLSSNWPGCYIPSMPPKKAIGNLQANFIEQRQQQLERFLIQTAQTQYFFNSDEFQNFIRGPEDFIRTSQSLKRQSFIDIGEKYLITFSDQCESVTSEQILEHETFCRATLAKLENFEQRCKKNIVNYENFFRFLDRSLVSLNSVSENLKVYGKNEGFDEIKPRDGGVCALKKKLVWIQSEILDFFGIIDVIKMIDELKKMKEKTSEKVANDKRNLSNYQSGKKSFKQKISKKSESEAIADGERSLEESSKTLEMIEKIIEICSFRLVKVIMPNFRAKKLEIFKDMLKCFFQESVEDLQVLISQSNQISDVFGN